VPIRLPRWPKALPPSWAKQIDDLGPAILLRTYARRTKKADARAAAVMGAMSQGVLG
jgi:hypothetical protein